MIKTTVTEPEPQPDYPCLKISSLGLIVFFSAPRKGTLLHSPGCIPPGSHSVIWEEGDFTPFPGTVTLKTNNMHDRTLARTITAHASNIVTRTGNIDQYNLSAGPPFKVDIITGEITHADGRPFLQLAPDHTADMLYAICDTLNRGL